MFDSFLHLRTLRLAASSPPSRVLVAALLAIGISPVLAVDGRCQSLTSGTTQPPSFLPVHELPAPDAKPSERWLAASPANAVSLQDGPPSAPTSLPTDELTGHVSSDVPRVELREWFPESFQQRRFLIADYQWISLLAIIILGMAADLLVRFLMHQLATAWFRIVRTQSEQRAEKKLWKPLGLLAQAAVWYVGALLINLPPHVSLVLTVGLKFFGVIVSVWTAFQLTDLASAYFARRAALTASRFDDLLVPLVSKSLKVFTLCMGLLFCAETFHLPITGLLGGLGLGGAALAFASKDAISNLFGSFTVLVDRPFEIGDWIIMDGVEGTVEQVGFRSTRIRTFYNSQISIPNSMFTTAVVDNMGRRHFRRVKTTLGVEYGTTREQVEAFCEGIRELLRIHPRTRKDNFYVNFHDFGACSLDILLYFFLDCRDRESELHARHELLLDIMQLAENLSVSFAFPTQTLHLRRDASHHDGATLQFRQPAAVGRHEVAKIMEQRAASFRTTAAPPVTDVA